MSEMSRERQIAERRAQIPNKYQATYDRAVQGKSLRAAVNAFCLECMCWQSREVALCADLACPLWAVRPYTDSGNGQEGQFDDTEPPMTDQESLWDE